MKNKKILIVEDEQIIAENLRFILNEYGYDFVDVAMDDTETEELFKDKIYDLVLMDINLGDTSTIDGIDLIKKLTKKYSFAYVYVTANADEKTVSKATETSPVGYIVKPFIKSSIYANVEIALSTLKKQEFFTHTHKGRQQQILVSKIIYVESEGTYIKVSTIDGNIYFVRKSLASFNDLYADILIRIHKSILINKNHIKEHTSKMVIINDKKLPIGRVYKESFEAQLKTLSFS